MGEGLCVHCKKTEAGEVGDISFTHRNFQVTTHKTGVECAECIKRMWIENFEENAKDFVMATDNGKAKVDWQRFERLNLWAGKKEKLFLIFVDLGILSFKQEGNWEVAAIGSLGMNPQVHFSYLYFVRKEDVIDFASANSFLADYQWEIHRITDVMSKKDVLWES